MTVENNVADAAVVNEVVVDTTVTKASPADVEAKLAETIAELEKNQELLKKVRRYEAENKKAADKALADQGEFKRLYEEEVSKRTGLETKINNQIIDTALQDAVKESGAKSVSTVLKLINKEQIIVEDGKVDTKLVATLIKELKLSDPVLFDDGTKEAPVIKKAGEGEVVGGFEKDIRMATSTRAIEAVMRRYGKM